MFSNNGSQSQGPVYPPPGAQYNYPYQLGTPSGPPSGSASVSGPVPPPQVHTGSLGLMSIPPHGQKLLPQQPQQQQHQQQQQQQQQQQLQSHLAPSRVPSQYMYQQPVQPVASVQQQQQQQLLQQQQQQQQQVVPPPVQQQPPGQQHVSQGYAPQQMVLSRFTPQDTLILRQLLLVGEKHKWKQITREINYRASKRRSSDSNGEENNPRNVSPTFVIKQYQSLLGLPNNALHFGSVGSSLPYVVDEMGWDSIVNVPNIFTYEDTE